jgi:hypothetical protein
VNPRRLVNIGIHIIAGIPRTREPKNETMSNSKGKQNKEEKLE